MKDSYPPCAAFHKNVAFFYLKAGFLFLIFEFIYTKCYKLPLLLHDLPIHIRHMYRITHIKMTIVIFIPNESFMLLMYLRKDGTEIGT
ncbi:hypothetical protein bcgnr5390_47550 [Bacillus luti]